MWSLSYHLLRPSWYGVTSLFQKAGGAKADQLLKKKQFVIAYRRNSWLHWQQCNQLLRRCPNTKRANLRRHWVCVAKTPSTQEALTARIVRIWCCLVTISKKIQLFEYCGNCSVHLTGCNANISSSTVLDLQSELHFRRRFDLWWLMMLLAPQVL